MSTLFELVQPALLPALLVEVVEHKLKILAGTPESYFVLATVEFIVLDFSDGLVDEDEAVDDVKHAPYFIELGGRVDQSQRVEVVDAAYFLKNETTLDELADLHGQLLVIGYL